MPMSVIRHRKYQAYQQQLEVFIKRKRISNVERALKQSLVFGRFDTPPKPKSFATMRK